MTLLSVEAARITVPPQNVWPDEPDSPWCCNPACLRGSSQTHHVIRRSFTAGPVRWVAVDGLVLLNECRVCLYCHDDLNNHNAWIRYLPGETWVWYRAVRHVERPPAGSETIQHPKSGRFFFRVGTLKEANC